MYREYFETNKTLAKLFNFFQIIYFQFCFKSIIYFIHCTPPSPRMSNLLLMVVWEFLLLCHPALFANEEYSLGGYQRKTLPSFCSDRRIYVQNVNTAKQLQLILAPHCLSTKHICVSSPMAYPRVICLPLGTIDFFFFF